MQHACNATRTFLCVHVSVYINNGRPPPRLASLKKHKKHIHVHVHVHDQILYMYMQRKARQGKA